ncbi:MAG: hypothetical protein ACKVU1_07810 [bacterium]
MRAILWLVICTVAMGSAVACSKGDGAAKGASSAKSAPHVAPGADAGAQHGAAGAIPGSYEDWCGEHGVPESMCTRCNGTLVAAFKATGDWCPEHGLPESQCLVCNPDLKIVRPPKPAAGM